MYLKPADLVGEQYEIIDVLGSGGFGITYLAKDTHCPDNPATTIVIKQIKVLLTNDGEAERDPNYLDKLELEANTLKDLNYPCIPKFLNSFFADNCYYIVQEYIQGHELSQEILPGVRLREEQAASILQEILEILQFIHKHGIIHRDVKPANIIRRDRDNKLVLIDFGAVKEIATEYTNDSGVTVTRIICSRGYTPAEQSSGSPRYNSDIYALGMMIMQAVTGFSVNAVCDPDSLPLRDNHCNYIWSDHAPHISPKLKEIISKMIRYYFRDRYQNAEDVLQDLEEYFASTRIITADRDSDNCIKKTGTIKSKIGDKLIDFYARYHKILKFIIIAIVACIASFLLFENQIFSSNACALELEDNISCGEEILDPLSKGSIRSWAARKYHQKEYSEALKYFKESWQKERHDAETLIYLNNALLDRNKIKAETISFVVPLSSDESKTYESSHTAQGFLRGVAQAQTEVNLSLSNSNPEIANQLSQYNFLPYRSINGDKNTGLKVVIVDDANKKEQAIQVAENIAKQPQIMGVVGHYTSGMTLNTVDIYRQNNLAQISYATTTKDLTQNPKSNFFRVVYSNQEEADALVKYILLNKIKQQKRIAIFYNPDSEYSNRFKIEIETKIEQLANPNISIVKEFNLADEKHFDTKSALKQLDKLGINTCLLLPDGQISNSLAEAIAVLKEDNGQRLMLGGNTLVNSKVTELETEQPLNLVVATFWHPTADPDSIFNQRAQQLWGSSTNGDTAMAYDATLTMIEAMKRQKKPTRKGTIEQLREENFSVSKAATGEIFFNTPKNGDRLDFNPTLVRLIRCQDSDRYAYAHLSLDDTAASNLACRN